MGSNPYRKVHLLGIAHPIVGKQFKVLEVCRGMKLTQDLSYEEKAMFDHARPSFFMCKEQGVVIKLVLYD